MPLNEHGKQKVSKWLSTRAGELPCPVCAHNNNHIDMDLLAPVPVVLGSDGKFTLEIRRFAPLLAVSCENCAFARFFSAVKMGLTAEDYA